MPRLKRLLALESEKKNVESYFFISSLSQKKDEIKEHSDFTQRAPVLDLPFKEKRRE